MKESGEHSIIESSNLRSGTKLNRELNSARSDFLPNDNLWWAPKWLFLKAFSQAAKKTQDFCIDLTSIFLKALPISFVKSVMFQGNPIFSSFLIRSGSDFKVYVCCVTTLTLKVKPWGEGGRGEGRGVNLIPPRFFWL